ncbi:MAG: hypothetical protein MI861_12580, partial [Pirellulales bacterium]|nr:hypothetical protein [Pirellulales bacterium]
VLPARLLQELTFSTFNSEPLSSFAQIVGCYLGSASLRDLPESCYAGHTLGFNSASGRRSELESRSSYAEFVLDQLDSGVFAEVEEFLTVCARLGIEQFGELELAFRIFAGGKSLSRQDFREGIQSKRLLKWVATHAEAGTQLLDWAAEFPSEVKACLESLVDRPDVLDALILSAGHVAEITMQAGEHDRRAIALLDVLFPFASDSVAVKVLLRLVESSGCAAEIRTEVRRALLNQWLRLHRRMPRDVAASLQRSLAQAPADQIHLLMEAGFSNDQLAEAVVECVCQQGSVSQTLATVLQGKPKLTCEVVQQLQEDVRRQFSAEQFFGQLVAQIPQMDWLDFLEYGRPKPASFVVFCFNHMVGQRPQSAAGIIARHRRRFGSVLQRPPLSVVLAEAIFSSHDQWISNGEVVSFLAGSMGGFGDRTDLHRRAAAVIEVTDFLASKRVDRESVDRLSAALPLLPPTQIQWLAQWLPARLCTPLWTIADFEHLWLMVQQEVETLGPNLPGGPSHLLAQIVSRCCQNSELWRNPALLVVLIEVSLRQGLGSKDEANRTLDQSMVTLLQQAYANCSQRTLHQVLGRASDFSDEARQRWERILEMAGRPSFLGHLTRVVRRALTVGWPGGAR